MSISYYIYYKVASEAAARVRPAVEALQRALSAKTGANGRLLCRRDKPETWMEVYDDVADAQAFEAALNAELERVGFAQLGAEPRRTEIFRPL
jgi:hypothetical protein